MAKCSLFNWKALSFLSPLLVSYSGHDPGVEIEGNMNRMEEVSVRKHQRHRSLLSLLPTPLLSCLQLSGPSCLFKAALTPQISCHPSLVPVHPFIHPSPLFFYISLSKITSRWVSAILPKKGIFILIKVCTQRQTPCHTRKQWYCLAKMEGWILENLTSLTRPVPAWVPVVLQPSSRQQLIFLVLPDTRYLPRSLADKSDDEPAWQHVTTPPLPSNRLERACCHLPRRDVNSEERQRLPCGLLPLPLTPCSVHGGVTSQQMLPKEWQKLQNALCWEEWGLQGCCQSNSCCLCLGPSMIPSLVSPMGRQNLDKHTCWKKWKAWFVFL